jgi:hypothetical protein
MVGLLGFAAFAGRGETASCEADLRCFRIWINPVEWKALFQL